MEDEHICYKDVRFQTNRFDALALSGDVNSFGQPPDKTPELTNTGSFEKCWRREGGVWWVVKAGKEEELFSELLAYRIGKLLGFPMAEYTEAGGYIKSRDFTSDAKVNFEPAAGLIGTEADYIKIYELLREADESLARQYISMCYFDALIYNMDRHENNFGVIRDGGTGGILSLAPLYDHNIALISRGYPRRAPSGSGGDILISDFAGLLRYAGKPFSVKELKEEEILAEAERIPFNPPITAEISEPKKFAASYISRREKALEEACGGMLSYSGGAGA